MLCVRARARACVCVHLWRRGLMTAIYDKRLDAQYADIQVIRYPAHDSYLADKAKYGIVTSQLHRFAERCVLWQDFVYDIALVFHRMTQKGYHSRRLWGFLRRFMVERPGLYDKRGPGCWISRVRRKLGDLRDGVIVPGPNGWEFGPS